MERYHRWVRRTTPWLTGLALLALVDFVLASAWGRVPFNSPVNYAAWAAFATDYGVRLYLVDDRLRFVRTHPLELLAVAVAVVLVGAGAVLDAERGAPGANIHTYGGAAWWAVTTVTTVGYGDEYPVTPEGQVIGGAVMVIGIGTMGTVTAALAYRFISSPETSTDPDPPPDPRLERIEARLDELTELLRDR